MNSISTSIVVIPGVVALLLCLLFSYLYQQSRQLYFRAWQIAWAAIPSTTPGCLPLLPAAGAVCVFCQLVVFGSDGSEHLRFDAPHPDVFPLSLV